MLRALFVLLSEAFDRPGRRAPSRGSEGLGTLVWIVLAGLMVLWAASHG